MITRLLEMGVDVSIAKKLARHQDIATTMGYVRSQNLPVKQAVDQLRNTNESPIKKIEN